MRLLESQIRKIIREEINFLFEEVGPSGEGWEGNEDEVVQIGDNIFAFGSHPIPPPSYGGTESSRRQSARTIAIGNAAEKIVSTFELENSNCVSKYTVHSENEEGRDYDRISMPHVTLVVKVATSDIRDQGCEASGIEHSEETGRVDSDGTIETGERRTRRGRRRAQTVETIGPSEDCQQSMDIEIEGTSGKVCISPSGNFVAQIGGQTHEYSLEGTLWGLSRDITIVSITRDSAGVITLNANDGDISEELTDRIAREIKAGIESERTVFEVSSSGKTLTFTLVS